MRLIPGKLAVSALCAAAVLLLLDGCVFSPAAPPHSSSAAAAAAARIDWPQRGNLNPDKATLASALELWQADSHERVADTRVLFAGNEGITGIENKECALLAELGTSGSGSEKVGWFIATNTLAPTGLHYVGQSAVSESSTALVADVTCPVAGLQSPSPSLSAGTQDTSNLRLLALAAPGYELQEWSGREVAPGQKPYRGNPIEVSAPGGSISVDLVKGSHLIETLLTRLNSPTTPIPLTGGRHAYPQAS